jgi:ubiquinone/menaquinone biosynthesis C-methylase UbiE
MVAQMNPNSQFIGIDLSEGMLKEAKDHIKELGLKNVDLKIGDITDLSQFHDKSIGTVFSTLSLHHLPTVHDLESTFSEVARIVKPDGGIYLSDFGHLNSEKSMQHFAYQHRERQPELFTIDYLNSLRAAFHLTDFQRLSAKHLAGRARLYSTFLIPLMVTIKSAKRGQVELALTQKLADLQRALPIPQQRDLKDLIGLFKLGGLKSTLLA